MQEADEQRDNFDSFDVEDQSPRPLVLPSRRRVVTALCVLLALALLLVVPPLVNVNRFRRQIANNIGRSLGRPVHLDSVTLNLLPMPGFTLGNFVVGDDPAFGAEPVIRANSVTVRVRVRSLWRRRVEFSRITLTDPSVNLVHLPDGRWNLESILLQAAKVHAAPTAEKAIGEAARFPYIEATGARVNVKMGLEKMPISLTDATFALWLPRPDEWRVRLEGHPARTDTAASDTGTVRLQGTLGRASSLDAVPVNLDGEWTAAPLGAVSLVLMGHDGGMRGEMNVHASVAGTVGKNTLTTRLQGARMRRADFVPERLLNVDINCEAQALALFHRLEEVRCAWPADDLAHGVAVSGVVPATFAPRSAQLAAKATEVPAAVLLDALRVASPRLAPELTLGGVVSGNARCCTGGGGGDFVVSQARLALGDAAPFVAGDVSAATSAGVLVVEPVEVDLGGDSPATLGIEAGLDGYRMHLTGMLTRARALELARALPQFGDGLEAALPEGAEVSRVDLVSTRSWTGGQVWSEAAVKRVVVRKRRR